MDTLAQEVVSLKQGGGGGGGGSGGGADAKELEELRSVRKEQGWWTENKGAKSFRFCFFICLCSCQNQAIGERGGRFEQGTS